MNYRSVGRVGGWRISVYRFHRHAFAECGAVLTDYAFELVIAVLDSLGAAHKRVFGLELVKHDFIVIVLALDRLNRICRVVNQHFGVYSRACNVQTVIFHKAGKILCFLQKAVIGVKTLHYLVNPDFFV